MVKSCQSLLKFGMSPNFSAFSRHCQGDHCLFFMCPNGLAMKRAAQRYDL
jgi:hypothetical protein